MRGRLIVIEGGDGAGKATQAGLLKGFLKEQKISSASITFPQYKGTFFGKTIAAILRGEMGELKKLHPYLLSMVYAMDRAEARDKMYQWLNHGKIVVLDRYVSSNMAHQAGRLKKSERGKFFKWLDDLEYKVNNLPREDVVIYLYVPYMVSQRLMMERVDRDYAKGKVKDIVEEDLKYLKNSEEVYLALAKKFPHWVKVACVDEDGNLRSREEIHKEIKKILAEKGILN
jgi:dTMP kinase